MEAHGRQPEAGRHGEVAPLVGRRHELAHLRRLLSTARLVTLTGAGGSGKTRLAAYAAESLSAGYADGVWVVDLGSLADARLLGYQVAAALGIHDRTSRSATDVVVDFLSDRTALLVLDSCEHLLDACAMFVGLVLRAAPRVRILCTSRQPLGMIGEHVSAVAPLPVPGREVDLAADAGTRFPALALFADRAAVAAPQFAMSTANRALVAEICRQLDGLPLAIELAAARAGALPLASLVAGLHDRFALLVAGSSPVARHRTLQAAFDWSYVLCSAPEQRLWQRLSVFSGSFEPDAAERVCAGQEVPAGAVFEHLTALVDKSVVVGEQASGRPRYRLLDTVRQYGLERLRATDDRGTREAELRNRHRDHYLDVAERLDRSWFGPGQAGQLDRLRTELPNVRAVLSRCLAVPEQNQAGVRLAGALDSFWFASGALHEGRYWLDGALATRPPPGPDLLRAMAAYSRILLVLGHNQAGLTLARECFAQAERLDQPRYAVRALAELGLGHVVNSEPEIARPLLEQALRRAAPLGADGLDAAANAGMMLGMATLTGGDPTQALARFGELAATCRAHGDQWWLGNALNGAALAALASGRPAQADGFLRESLPLRRDLGDRLGIVMSLETLAWTAAAEEEFVRAARLLGAASREWDAVGKMLFGAPYLLHGHEAYESGVRAALGEGRYAGEFRRGAGFTTETSVRYALSGNGRPAG